MSLEEMLISQILISKQNKNKKESTECTLVLHDFLLILVIGKHEDVKKNLIMKKMKIRSERKYKLLNKLRLVGVCYFGRPRSNIINLNVFSRELIMVSVSGISRSNSFLPHSAS